MSSGQTEKGLTPEELQALRGGYKNEVLREASRQALNGRNPAGADFVNGVIDTLYQGEPLSHVDRERCLIAVLAGRQEPLTLAVHIYWGLMEGLGPEEVGHTLVLAGAYQGIPVYATGLLALEKTTAMLKGLAAEGAVDSGSVLKKIIETF